MQIQRALLAWGIASLAVYGQAPGTTKRAARPPAKGWQIEERVNKLDDTKTIVATLASDEGNGMLALRCKSENLDAMLNWGVFLSTRSVPVTLRLDSAKAETYEWSISTDHQALIYPSVAEPFIRELVPVRRLIVQVTPYSRTPMLSTFTLRGTEAVFARLATACPYMNRPE